MNRLYLNCWCVAVVIALSVGSPARAGSNELIFVSGFEDTQAMINCPSAAAMSMKMNSSGGFFFDGQDAIDPAGDMDYFAVPASAGEWLQIAMDANPNSDPALIDTVITVFSSDGTRQLARSDDATPSIGPDSELFYRAVDAGPLCVSVEDRSTAFGQTPEGGPQFTYRLVAVPLDFMLYDFYNEDTEDNDSTLTPQTGLTYVINDFNGQNSTAIAGRFDDAADVDVYLVETPPGALGLSVTFTPDGINGYGGTTPPGIIELLAGDGTTVIGRLDYANGSAGLSLPANPSQSYFLAVNDPPMALGDNPFYVLKFATLDGQNQQETNDAGNGVFAGAEVADPFASPTAVRHFIGGTLSGGSDTDLWSFQADAGDTVAVFCASQRNGSGVLAMNVQMFANPPGAPLQSDTETATEDLAWSSSASATRPLVTITTTGTHYLSLEASSFSAQLTDRHYQCGIHRFIAP